MKISFIAIIAAFMAPALAAKTWDVNVVNGKFSPQELDIAPGDTVRWPNNDGADHAIVQTNSGARSCNNMAGGFNSGRKTKGQAYQRTFAKATTVNYKDGIGANCLKGAQGTIYVHTGARPGVTPSKTAAPITKPSNSASSFSSSEKSVLLGVACFIGALAL
ncbi:hypothetical protein EMPS_07052 [Entomortierella parvispora]|uniref:Blue (type 1) copper domain-containing protein n=1 Tax=Entomortierella parvispora TaxID=205924 RepID=A0A9P3LXZ4_9FUNG|nr:hypothetical protein EMPS_07052 [Entomortierella parvispora]